MREKTFRTLPKWTVEDNLVKKQEKPKDRPLNVRIPQDMYDEIRRHAFWSRGSQSSVFRDALKNQLAILRKTNAKHMIDGKIENIPGE